MTTEPHPPPGDAERGRVRLRLAPVNHHGRVLVPPEVREAYGLGEAEQLVVPAVIEGLKAV
jgi:hypothetical protein